MNTITDCDKNLQTEMSHYAIMAEREAHSGKSARGVLATAWPGT